MLLIMMMMTLVGRESYGGGGLLLPELGVHGASFLVFVVALLFFVMQ